jgi:hypothetical protein
LIKQQNLQNGIKGLLEQIKACNSVYRMRFPVKMDDGRIEVIEAYTEYNIANTKALVKEVFGLVMK